MSSTHKLHKNINESNPSMSKYFSFDSEILDISRFSLSFHHCAEGTKCYQKIVIELFFHQDKG